MYVALNLLETTKSVGISYFYMGFQRILFVGIDPFWFRYSVTDRWCVQIKYADSKMDNTREGYTLLYQDKEGDWMLVGDVQWE